jgi:hypothetical protein
MGRREAREAAAGAESFTPSRRARKCKARGCQVRSAPPPRRSASPSCRGSTQPRGSCGTRAGRSACTQAPAPPRRSASAAAARRATPTARRTRRRACRGQWERGGGGLVWERHLAPRVRELQVAALHEAVRRAAVSWTEAEPDRTKILVAVLRPAAQGLSCNRRGRKSRGVRAWCAPRGVFHGSHLRGLPGGWAGQTAAAGR